MRIRSGRLKGRELRYPRSGLRPTKDITRLAIFNALGRAVAGARVADLFAGGGALGLEALSRGAAEAVFVESSAAVARFLRANVAGLECAAVVRGDVFRALHRLGPARFDIVLADPPYRLGLVEQTLEALAREETLSPGGLAVVEHHRLEPPAPDDAWEVARQGRYGESMVTFLRRKSE
ncbi:16S rRNA (guanine(966)-N(2))-methyltransferase RsmD [candidate division WOR-3 bacterium]|nr:16S rRNA (guanine(966)-N(2))-methyltransferase RsmD [candidate division WOR-3 bacterium]